MPRDKQGSRDEDEAQLRMPYLYFEGECEAALMHYVRCGLGEIKELRRYGQSPLAGDNRRDKVLHSVFEGPHIRLCASDGADSERMKGGALALEIGDAVQWAINCALSG